MDDFRAWVRGELAARLAPRRNDAPTSVLGAGNDDLEAGRRYLGALADTGLAVPMWPREYGGLGATPEQIGIVRAELGAFDVPDRMVRVILPSDGIATQLKYPVPPVAPTGTPLIDVIVASEDSSAMLFPALRNVPSLG